MKKVKLIKSILISAPVIVAPLLANSCSSKNNGNKAKDIIVSDYKKINPSQPTGAYWVDALAKTLQDELTSIASKVASTAVSDNTLDITPQINEAIARAKKVVTVEPVVIDTIDLNFSGSGNLKIAKNSDSKYILTVYPSFITSSSSKPTVTTTLSLTWNNKKTTKTITNTYSIAKGFKNYTKNLGDGPVRGVYALPDGNTIYGGTNGGGISIGTWNGQTYDFKTYTESLNDAVFSVYAVPDGSKIYSATYGGGIAVATKTAEGNYLFKNYTNSEGLASNNVEGIYASSDGNTIYAGTTEGVSVGTKDGDTYNFTNYTDGLGNKLVRSIYASPDGNTIYAGTDGGVSIGTKSGTSYTFKNYTSGLGNTTIYSIYPASDGNIIYAATLAGISVGTRANDSYTFKNYTSGLGSILVRAIYASSNNNTIYAGTDNGFTIGTKTGSSYRFNNYTAGLGNETVYSTYATDNDNIIIAGTGDGLSVTKANWFTSSNLSYLANNHQAITLNNKHNI